MAQNIASGVGGEVSERRRRGGDDHLAVVVWLVCGSDSEVRSDDDIRPSPLRRGPHGALARRRRALVAGCLARRPAARLVCARKQETQQIGSEEFGGYVRRENQKKHLIENRLAPIKL